MTGRRILLVWVVIALATLTGLFSWLLVAKTNGQAHTQWAVEALQRVNLQRAAPVSEAMLELNAVRSEAGLGVIDKGWKAVLSDLQMSHGRLTVLLNADGKPVKVLFDQFFLATNSPLTEYEVVDGKTIGTVTTWRDTPPKLFKVESTKNGKLSGLTTYYAANGERIGVCEFLKDKPWNGQLLERAGFSKTNWDVTYKEGNLHGSEKHFDENGTLERIRTFQEGKLHGPQQEFYQGQLRVKEVFENGFPRSRKGWHQNGKLNCEEYFTQKGAREGIRRMWNEAGELELEESYRNGKEHGRRWWKGHREAVWFFNGKFLAGGAVGEAEFNRLKK